MKSFKKNIRKLNLSKRKKLSGGANVPNRKPRRPKRRPLQRHLRPAQNNPFLPQVHINHDNLRNMPEFPLPRQMFNGPRPIPMPLNINRVLPRPRQMPLNINRVLPRPRPRPRPRPVDVARAPAQAPRPQIAARHLFGEARPLRLRNINPDEFMDDNGNIS